MNETRNAVILKGNNPMKRIFVLLALVAAFLSSITLLSVQAQQNHSVIVAQGNPYHLDFVTRLSKSGDLRLNVSTKGLDFAFSDWLSIAHPDAYRNALKQVASTKVNSNFKSVVHSSRAIGSCCIMSAGCCSMCPDCCKQKSCSKSCCNLSACNTRPNCCQ